MSRGRSWFRAGLVLELLLGFGKYLREETVQGGNYLRKYDLIIFLLVVVAVVVLVVVFVVVDTVIKQLLDRYQVPK